MLKMEIMIPVPSSMDFDFNSARSTPYSSAPSTPKRFGEYFFSAPTSPTRASEFYHEFDNEVDMINEGSSSSSSMRTTGFDWGERAGTPDRSSKAMKAVKAIANNKEDEFAFEFSEELEKSSLSAEELFDGGKIKPIKPPPRSSPLSNGKRMVQKALSPKHKKQAEPFDGESTNKKTGQERGRERVQNLSSTSRRAARSLSPYRVSQYPWIDEEQQQQQQQQQQQNTKQPVAPSSSLSSSSSSSSSKSYRKWNLKDFLLFRNASEGRASDKDPLKKYATLIKKNEDTKNSSFRSTDNYNSGSKSKRRGHPVSAHELHYTKNRAASEDLKKKTFLPYKQGILGRLAFNPSQWV